MPMRSGSCFIVDEESTVIGRKEVHEERELVHTRSLLVSWLDCQNVVIHCKKCLGVACMTETISGGDPALEVDSHLLDLEQPRPAIHLARKFSAFPFMEMTF